MQIYEPVACRVPGSLVPLQTPGVGTADPTAGLPATMPCARAPGMVAARIVAVAMQMTRDRDIIMLTWHLRTRYKLIVQLRTGDNSGTHRSPMCGRAACSPMAAKGLGDPLIGI